MVKLAGSRGCLPMQGGWHYSACSGQVRRCRADTRAHMLSGARPLKKEYTPPGFSSLRGGHGQQGAPQG